MDGMLQSPGLGRFVEIDSTCARPPMLAETFEPGLNVDLRAQT